MFYEFKEYNSNIQRKKKSKGQNIILKFKKYYFLFFLIIISQIQNNIMGNIKYHSKISIIIPTYNRGKLISKAIKSCLRQTYNLLEIIVIDDCSKDNTKKVVKKIKDIRVKYIKLLNHKGASYSRNFGIKKAKGNYITFLDSDDIFLPEKLKNQINNLKKKKSDLDFCKMKRIKGKQIKIFPNSTQEIIIKKGNIYNELLTHGNFISTQTILVKKLYIEKYLFDENMPRLQDFELLIRMLPSIKVSFTNKILVNSYFQKDSISNSGLKYINAIRLLLKKNYSLNLEQKKNFTKFLNHNLYFSYKTKYH